MAGRFDQKKREDGPARRQDAEQDQEESQEVEGREPEHARLQAQVGNQGVLSMLGSESAGGAGLEVEGTLRKKAGEKSGPALGGDDDPVDDGMLTIDDLTATWNQGARKSPDRAKWADPMPADELPPEDEALLDEVTRVTDAPDLPASVHSDPLVQPSAEVVAVALTDWARGVHAWASAALTDQVLARVIAPAIPALQDPFGRVLFGRARVGAIGSLVLQRGPVLSASADISVAATVDSCLELWARRHRVRTIRVLTTERIANQLPVAADVFLDHVGKLTGSVEPREPGQAAARALTAALVHLVEFDDALALVPDLGDLPADDDDDDPLGLDAILAEHTGGAREPDAGLYDSAVQAAERIATEAARSRVQLAGAAIAVADVAEDWSVGAPVETLYEALGAFDREVGSCLQLLVEIARAAQRRSVPPSGLRNGLRRGARVLDRGRARAVEQLVRIVAGVVPGTADELPFAAPAPEWLAQPFAVGNPLEALVGLRAQPPSPDRDAAIVLVKAAAGAPAVEVADELARARHHCTDPLQSAALGVLVGAAALADDRLDDALAVARAQLDLGRRRRNGLVLADAALLAMEVWHRRGDEATRREVQLQSGNLLWRMGARGGLSLVARWTPPEDEDADEAPLET